MSKLSFQNHFFKSSLANRLKLVAVILTCLLFSYSFSSCTSPIREKTETESPYQPQVPDTVQTVSDMKNVDFSKFEHNSQQHKNTPCLFCHVRNDDSPKMKMASHTSCIGCHAQQFEDKNHAICATCHTDNANIQVKDFPTLKTHNVVFNHEAHFKETNCASCHQNQGGGGMTIPAGANAHANCFQCHTPEKTVGEKNIGSCSTCHQEGSPNRISDTARSIGFNFNHANHSSVSCQSCHNTTSGNQMSAITVAMHAGQANSCATCHNEKRAFGANDFSDCRQCHQEVGGAKSFGVKFNHSSHAKTDCATCHKSTKTANFTTPNGEAAHTTCYQCHSPNKNSSGFSSSKCFQCHQIGGSNDITPARQTFAGNFNHSSHKAMSCNSCHTTRGGQMNAPTVAMHKAGKNVNSCATCHNNQKAFGEDFTNCRRCHTGANFKF